MLGLPRVGKFMDQITGLGQRAPAAVRVANQNDDEWTVARAHRDRERPTLHAEAVRQQDATVVEAAPKDLLRLGALRPIQEADGGGRLDTETKGPRNTLENSLG